MKLLKLIALFGLMVAGVGNAATTIYTVTTGTVATSNGIANSNGLQYQSSSVAAFTSAGAGTIAFGYFSISDSEITTATSVSSLVAAFQNWNTSGTSTFNAPGPTQQRGVFSITAAARDVAASGFDGQSMYVFVGNGTTLANSTEILILKTTFTFSSSESGPTAYSKTVTTSNSTVLVGSLVSNVYTTGTDTSTTPGWQTIAVPEPSAALLGLLGAFGFVRRRR